MKYTPQDDEKIIKGVEAGKSWKEIGKSLNRSAEACRGRYKRLRESDSELQSKEKPELPPEIQVEADRRVVRLSKTKKETDKKYKMLLEDVERLEQELEIALETKEFHTGIIPYKVPSKKKSEAIAVVVASDWHLEEQVKPEKVNGLNEYNLEIAELRAKEFFQNTVRLLKKEQQDVQIDTLVLALLGDFISSNIHDELLENCLLRPADAILFAEELIASGIEYILEHTDVNLVIPCCVGNHTRITRRVHISTEQGNSLETIMYAHLSRFFRNDKRVKFVIARGYHQYLTLFDNYTIRFHHGHAIRFAGGVGGIYIPARKAIAQWQKVKHADLDVFGHFHNYKIDGDLFVLNGSLVGFNAFAIQIKADYERPRQSFFLVDRKRGKTVHVPITFSK
jgi:hypothetical protein